MIADDAVLVIGIGLSGGWIIKQLADAGFRVIALDAGPSLAPGDVMSSEPGTSPRRAAARRQPIQATAAAYWLYPPHLFVDDFDHPYTVVANCPFTWIRGRQVGGRSVTWGGVTLRLSDYEFRDPDRDGCGPRWPISYADVAPYYSEVERFMGVSGSLERLPQLPDGLFLPATAFTAAEEAFKATTEAAWPDRRVIHCRGIASGVAEAAGTDRRWAPHTSLYHLLPAALATGRVTLRPDTIVSHLLVDPKSARVKGAACIDRRSKMVFDVDARVVVLCASTIESVRILLNSRSPQHPGGIGNSSGVLGRGIMDHIAVRVAGPITSGQREPVVQPLRGPQAISIPRFRNLQAAEGLPFIRGYGVWGGIGRRVSQNAREPSWTLNALLEVLSRDENRVEIDQGVEDAWGIKAVHIQLRYSENESRMAEDAAECLLEMAAAARLDVRKRSVSGPGAYVHELGGARMGSDPASSVLSAFNQCWDSPNLFVVDGSCFVSAGWQNPTLTMMALAARASAFIVEEARRGNL